MPDFAQSLSEQQINWFREPKFIDPFCLLQNSNQEKKWDEAKKIDSLFAVPRIKGSKGMRDGYLWCPDCNRFITCAANGHSAFIRCFGEGGHCATC